MIYDCQTLTHSHTHTSTHTDTHTHTTHTHTTHTQHTETTIVFDAYMHIDACMTSHTHMLYISGRGSLLNQVGLFY